MLEQFQTRRQILFDLTANFLEPLNGSYQRLAYLSSLRRPSTGRYVQDQLAAVYGEEPVDEVLACCHEEVFERLLEMPLNAQEEDLRRHLNSLPGSLEGNANCCREIAKTWIPPRAPSYLNELFCSNTEVLLALLLERKTTAHLGT